MSLSFVRFNYQAKPAPATCCGIRRGQFDIRRRSLLQHDIGVGIGRPALSRTLKVPDPKVPTSKVLRRIAVGSPIRDTLPPQHLTVGWPACNSQMGKTQVVELRPSISCLSVPMNPPSMVPQSRPHRRKFARIDAGRGLVLKRSHRCGICHLD